MNGWMDEKRDEDPGSGKCDRLQKYKVKDR